MFNSWQSLSLLQNSISAFGLLVCSFILSRRVIEGEMDVGNYVAFVSYLNQLYSPLNQISSLYRRVMNNAVGASCLGLLVVLRTLGAHVEPPGLLQTRSSSSSS